jgi:4-carboxymuconolactone decarboxylase
MMARIPTITEKAALPAAHHDVWDAIARSRGRVQGPFTVLLHSPELTRRIAHVGAWVRFESPLPPADRELAVIAAARAMDCRFEWGAHEAEAVKAGVRREAIAAVRDRRAPAGLTEEEALVVAYVTQLLQRHRVDAATFAAMRERFGVDGLVELTATVGYYGMLACVLNAFDVVPEAGADLLPD